MQVRTFEPNILYKNKKKENFNPLLPGGNKKVTHTCVSLCVFKNQFGFLLHPLLLAALL